MTSLRPVTDTLHPRNDTVTSPEALTSYVQALRPGGSTRDPVVHDCSAEQVPRPETGTEFVDFSEKGLGQLRIHNGTSHDAVALLVRTTDGEPYRAVFVRSGDWAEVREIAQGTYRLRFQLGSDWLASARFCHVHGTKEFVQPLSFQEIAFPSGTVRYSIFQVTLHAVVGGTAPTRHIPASDFSIPEP